MIFLLLGLSCYVSKLVFFLNLVTSIFVHWLNFSSVNNFIYILVHYFYLLCDRLINMGSYSFILKSTYLFLNLPVILINLIRFRMSLLSVLQILMARVCLQQMTKLFWRSFNLTWLSSISRYHLLTCYCMFRYLFKEQCPVNGSVTTFSCSCSIFISVLPLSSC